MKRWIETSHLKRTFEIIPFSREEENSRFRWDDSGFWVLRKGCAKEKEKAKEIMNGKV